MNFTGFYGNDPIKTVLNTHLFHAYLIEGPDGSGKHTLANLLTNALVCDSSDGPCGICRQCYKVQQGCHPDIIDIPAEIPVEDLRNLLAGLLLSPNDAKHKVYRIDRAEKMRQEAQNLLLKSLEEPPSYAVFILLCTSKEGVLQTVRSRCQTLTMAPLPEEILREHFTKVYGKYDERAQGAVLLSAGFLGKALELYESGESKITERCRQLEQAVRKNDPREIFRIFNFKEREELTAFYKAFSLYLKRRLSGGTADQRRFYADFSRQWESASDAMQTNINVKFWNTNLARLCQRARSESI